MAKQIERKKRKIFSFGMDASHFYARPISVHTSLKHFAHPYTHSPDPAAKTWDFELVGQQLQQNPQGSHMSLPGMELALSNSFGFGGVNVSLLFRRCT